MNGSINGNMNGNMNMINMNGLNNNQQGMSMIQGQNFVNPLFPQQQTQQAQQPGIQAPQQPQQQVPPQQIFNQNQSMHFPNGQQNVPMTPGMNPMNGQANRQINGNMNVASQQPNPQHLVMQQQMQPIGQQIPQQRQPSQPQQRQQVRPNLQRATSVQQIGSTPVQMTANKINTQYNPNAVVTAPNSAPLPIRTPSAGNSQGHTPQMTAQPPPNQFSAQLQQPAQQPGQKNGSIANNVTPIMQQQPTPQSQSRGMSQQGNPMSMPNQMNGHGPKGMMPNGQEVFPNELQARINRRNMGNTGIIRILDLVDQICNESLENLVSLEYWQRLIQTCFLSMAILRLTTARNNPPVESMFNNYYGKYSANENEFSRPYSKLSSLSKLEGNVPYQFELNASTAPIFFTTAIRNGDLLKFVLSLPGLKFQVMNNGSIFIISGVTLNFTYKDGSSSVVDGNCKILMNKEFKIEWIDCRLANYQPSIDLTSLQMQWKRYNENNQERTNTDFFDFVSKSSKALELASNSGINEHAMRVMQVGDIMSSLRTLMGFSLVNNINSPTKALELFMTANNNQRQLSQGPKSNIEMSSPSPRTIHPDDPKATVKKRQSSTSMPTGSPYIMDRASPSGKRRK